jgi:LPXTG-site transpeptidase (sortase) family protein
VGASRVPDPSAPREEPVGHRKWWPTGLLAASLVSLFVVGTITLGSGVEDRGAHVIQINARHSESTSADHLVDAPTKQLDGQKDRATGAPRVTTPDQLESQTDANEEPVLEPTHVTIPALNVDTTVVTVGLDVDRAVEVPENIDIVGWYEHAAAPGSQAGSAVLVGHRDGSGGRKGAFYSIGNLEIGERVEVVTEFGTAVQYEVVSRELIDNSDFDANAARLFAVDGSPRLTLITCGGLYDRTNGGYQANVVVTAEPILFERVSIPSASVRSRREGKGV